MINKTPFTIVNKNVPGLSNLRGDKVDLRTYEELNSQEKMVQKLERIENAIKDSKLYFRELEGAIVRCSSRKANEEILKVLKNIFYTLIFIAGWLCVFGYQLKEHL